MVRVDSFSKGVREKVVLFSNLNPRYIRESPEKLILRF